MKASGRRLSEMLIVAAVVAFLVVSFSPLPTAGPSPSITKATTLPLAASTTITSCTEAALAAAIAAGGTATFGVSCTPLVMSSPISILANQTISVSAGAQTVYLSGNGVTQLFIIEGGALQPDRHPPRVRSRYRVGWFGGKRRNDRAERQ